MSSIDERVVQMQFDNKQFESGIKTTLSSLDLLNKGLKLEGATKGLTDVSTAASKFSLAGISSGVDNIAAKFKAMSVVGIAALASITTKAVTAGVQLAKSFSVDPILQGLDIYQTKLNSIQTILANTSADHTTLKNVTDALQQLNDYSNQTIYNFGEMARNVGTFTAAGVKLKDSVSAIKGIANLAAISGSSSEQASTAMYQLSQALASGTVKLQDWNSVVNAGMGGKVFQTALMETARVHGVAIDKMVKEEGSFRNTLQKGWLTSQILSETLSHFAGDLNDQQLKAQGYTAAQIKQLHVLAQTAIDAATKVKTFPQLMDVLKETVSTGWAQSFEILFGNIDEAKTLFTSINNVIGGFISASSAARNKVLGDWKALGGRTALLAGIANVFHDLIAVIKPIKDAFRDIFPAVTGKQLADLSKSFEKFTAGLKIGADTADKIKRTFAGLFAVFKIGVDIVKGILGVIGDLFSEVGKGSGGFLNTTASIGDFLVALKDSIEAGQGLTKFFAGLEKVLKAPLIALGAISRAIKEFFSGIDINAGPVLDRLQKRFAPFGVLGNVIATVFAHTLGALESFVHNFDKVTEKIRNFFSGFQKMVSGAVGEPIDFSKVLDSINTGLFAGALLLLRKFLKNGISLDAGGGFFGALKESVEGLTGTLKAMQTQLKANALLKIAAAIGLLAISMVALSLIDSNRLTAAGVAMTGMFTELLASMARFTKISGAAGFVKMPILTASMIGLAIAIDLLVISVVALSKLDWNALAKGLTGLGVILAELTVTMKLMPPRETMISTGAGLILLAAAIRILVGAVTDLSGLSWSEMAKGLVGVGGLLASLALFTRLVGVDKAGVFQGAGLVLLAVGIRILVSAVQDFSKMSWGEIAKGLVTLAGALVIISGALIAIPPTAPLSALAVLGVAISLGKVADALDQFGQMSWGEILKGLTAMLGALTIISAALIVIPPTAPLGAASILIVALALGQIGDALEKFGGMSWGEIGKAAVVLAGSLAIIALAMAGMIEALPGAAALLVVAASLAILSPVLQAFGDMSLAEIGKSMLVLAGVFTILGLAGLVLTPLIPTLLGLGVAVTLLGVGMLAAGAGVFLFATGLTALAAAGSVGAAAIVGIVSALLGLIPTLMEQIGLGVIAFAKVIATAGPAIFQAMTTVLNSLLDAIAKLTPKIASTLLTLIVKLLNLLADNVPKMVTAGLRLLTGILNGIANNIGKVVAAATNVIVNFLNGISKNLPRVIDAGIKLIISFVNGLANGIRNNTAAMRSAGINLAGAIIDGMTFGLASGVGKVVSEAKHVASAALDSAKHLLGINSPSKEFVKIGMGVNEGFALGLDKYSHLTSVSAAELGKTAITTVSKSLSSMANLVSGNIDLVPKITPVLDLSAVKKDAGTISKVLAGSVPIKPISSFVQANGASVGQEDNNDARRQFDDQPKPGQPPVNFTQNNYSPKALSEAEIYRQTKNQLSKIKEVVVP